MTKWEDQSKKYHEMLREIGELHDKKGSDYGTDGDQYANIRASEEFGIEPWVGAYVRLNDKIARIKTFIQKGRLQNESVEDSLLDVAVYALNALAIYREGKEPKEPW